MRVEDARRIERCLDGQASVAEQQELDRLSQQRPDVRSAAADASLVRSALLRTGLIEPVSVDLTARVCAALAQSPPESVWQSWMGRLSDGLHVPATRWAMAAAVLAAVMLPMGYFGVVPLGYRAEGTAAHYVESDLPGATIFVRVHVSEQGIENGITWVIGKEGAAL